MAAASDLVELRAGDLALDLAPAIGGSVASFRLGGIDLMRPLSASDRSSGNVLGVAMFPMLPYANRISGNAFTFGGKTYNFPANNPTEKYNVHGTGWQRPWRLAGAGPSEALLQLELIEPGEAYAYRATQRFALDPSGLTVTVTLTNTGRDTMPFGLGLHPWFERDADVTLQFTARRFYLEEPDGVSGNPVSIPPELDFTAARPLPQGWRNNDYGGWDGVAELRWPRRGVALRIAADSLFKHLMIYADPAKPHFCVEPQTNASGAFNRPGAFDDPGEGVIVLAPGMTAEASVRFEAMRV
ncbi:MAG: aldose 1-epimerase [Devosia nanyangense]|uniref:Aldose 1-epimerase n=1 Tax=Devosia nanyangense TaxID=1228055 RepID=A0A933P133_9HYPH|nr:aldose 1-epimerase [Devosia nanyangense]